MLTRLLESTRRRVAEQQGRIPLDQLMEKIHRNSPESRRPALADVMNQNTGIAVIAEIKRSSPSKGSLAPDLNPARLAQRYQTAGAAAVSVLTEPTGFGGSADDLIAVRCAVTCPVLRKDFILTAYQVTETAALQADILLLIAAALSDWELARLHRIAADLHLQCLLEIHDQEELHRVLALPLDPGRDYIGINNRNLKTFQVSLETTFHLAPQVPAELAVISESGIRTRAQVEKLQEIGVKGILVGESLVTAADPGAVLQELRGEINP
jgi:indole-3-glycerol phosphate synthase